MAGAGPVELPLPGRTDTEPTELRERLRSLAAERRRFGYRRLTVLLRREGWAVNPKRVYRLYREEGLAVRRREDGKRPESGGADTVADADSGPIRSGRWTSRRTLWRADGSFAR